MYNMCLSAGWTGAKKTFKLSKVCKKFAEVVCYLPFPGGSGLFLPQKFRKIWLLLSDVSKVLIQAATKTFIPRLILFERGLPFFD